MGLTEQGREALKDGAMKMGVSLDLKVLESLCAYLDLVEETNAHTNLTRITGDDAVTGHFLDALSIVQVMDLSSAKSLVDVGTGLGVPGIVLKIVYPHLEVLLLDSLQKRVSFLSSCIERLGLNKVTAVHGRAEDLSRERYRERYDFCVSRAVANLTLLSELCIPFVKVGGSFIAYKGDLDSSELSESSSHIKLLGLEIPRTQEVHIPGMEARRVFVYGKKITHTPAQYPRSSKALAKAAGK